MISKLTSKCNETVLKKTENKHYIALYEERKGRESIRYTDNSNQVQAFPVGPGLAPMTTHLTIQMPRP
jgi:hypothetical protein